MGLDPRKLYKDIMGLIDWLFLPSDAKTLALHSKQVQACKAAATESDFARLLSSAEKNSTPVDQAKLPEESNDLMSALNKIQAEMDPAKPAASSSEPENKDTDLSRTAAHKPAFLAWQFLDSNPDLRQELIDKADGLQRWAVHPEQSNDLMSALNKIQAEMDPAKPAASSSEPENKDTDLSRTAAHKPAFLAWRFLESNPALRQVLIDKADSLQGWVVHPEQSNDLISALNKIQAEMDPAKSSASSSEPENKDTDLSQAAALKLALLAWRFLDSNPALRQDLELNLDSNKQDIQGTTGRGQGDITKQTRLNPELVSSISHLLQRIQALHAGAEAAQGGINPQAKAADKNSWTEMVQSLMQINLKTDLIKAELHKPSEPAVHIVQAGANHAGTNKSGEHARLEGTFQGDALSFVSKSLFSGTDKEALSDQGRNLLAGTALLHTNSAGQGQSGSGPGLNFGHYLHSAADQGSGPGSITANNGNSPGLNPQGLPVQGFESRAFAAQQVFEQNVMDQVRFRLQQGLRSGQQEIVVRMHPRELGMVRLSLVAEDGNLRAHLHVQSQNVQDVLERNMSRLRESLAEQGLNLQDFAFSSEDQSNTKQDKELQHEQYARSKGSARALSDSEPLYHGRDTATKNIRDGLSLRI